MKQEQQEHRHSNGKIIMDTESQYSGFNVEDGQMLYPARLKSLMFMMVIDGDMVFVHIAERVVTLQGDMAARFVADVLHNPVSPVDEEVWGRALENASSTMKTRIRNWREHMDKAWKEYQESSHYVPNESESKIS